MAYFQPSQTNILKLFKNVPLCIEKDDLSKLGLFEKILTLKKCEQYLYRCFL
jgi:hypothetical protein